MDESSMDKVINEGKKIREEILAALDKSFVQRLEDTYEKKDFNKLKDIFFNMLIKIMELKEINLLIPLANGTNCEIYIKYQFFKPSETERGLITSEDEEFEIPDVLVISNCCISDDYETFYIRIDMASKPKSYIYLCLDISKYKSDETEEARSQILSEVFREETAGIIADIYKKYFLNEFEGVYNSFNDFLEARFDNDKFAPNYLINHLAAITDNFGHYFMPKSIIQLIKTENISNNIELLITKQDFFEKSENISDIKKIYLQLISKEKVDQPENSKEPEINFLISPENIEDIDNRLKEVIMNRLGKTLPDDIESQVIKKTLENRPENEFLRIILLNIYALCNDRQGKASEENIEKITSIWNEEGQNGERHIDKLKRHINEYLITWSCKDSFLYLTPEWLIAWFGVKILNSKTFEAYNRNKDKFSPEAILLFHKRTATVLLFVLHWIRSFGNTRLTYFKDVPGQYKEFLESFIYILCEYVHIDAGLTREADLFRSMRFMWSQQSAIYTTTSENYRDHLHHVIEVCLIGLFLLEIDSEDDKIAGFFDLFSNWEKPKNKNFLSKIRRNIGESFEEVLISRRKKLYRNWIVASLMHDIGYIADHQSMLLDQLGFFDEDLIIRYRDQMKQSFSASNEELAKESHKQLKKIIPAFPLSRDKAKKIDHGIISAVQISELVDVQNKQWLNDIKPAIEAAAMHNHKDITINPASNPLAFFLFLCDNLQEWDRPMVKGEDLRYSVLVNIVHKSGVLHQERPFVDYLVIEGVDIDNSKDRLSVNYVKKSREIKFILYFAPDWEMKYYPPLTWTGHTRAFQRLENCKIPIKVILKHPVKTAKKVTEEEAAKEKVDEKKAPKEKDVEKKVDEKKTSEKIKTRPLQMDLLQTFLMESGKNAPHRAPDKKQKGNALLRQWVANALSPFPNHWIRYVPPNLNKENEDFESLCFDLCKAGYRKEIADQPDNFIPHYIEWVNKYREGNYTPPEMSSF